MQDPVANRNLLKKRLFRFFEEPPEERWEISSLVRNLNGLAEVFVFGGLIRDICFHGIRDFSSDVDLVVKVIDRDGFDELMNSQDVSRNRFGGYRIEFSRWQIDLWEFQNTWAFSEGLVVPVNDDSLLDTTFFNWDSIYYNVFSRQLSHSETYFDDVQKRFLDLKLMENPNRFGSFVRALRMILRERATTGRNMTCFLLEQLNCSLDSEILEYERAHFSKQMLSREVLGVFRKVEPDMDKQVEVRWVEDSQLDLFPA